MLQEAFDTTRQAALLKTIGNSNLELLATAATVASGAFGGPAASSAVSSLRGLSYLVSGGSDLHDGQDFRLELFRLQSAVNTQSQTNKTITNLQKVRHDAMMATIQNTR